MTRGTRDGPAEGRGHVRSSTAPEDRLAAGRDESVRELRRQEATEAPQPAELRHLALDALLERPVQLRELGGLGPDRVVVALDAEQRAHARQQLVAVERLLHEVVRARLDPILFS